jgi:protein XagA
VHIYLIFFIFSIIEIIAYEEPHHTTAFISPPQSWSTLITYSHYSTRHFWNKNGKKLPAFNDFKEEAGLFYSEYALNASNALFIHGGYSLVKESMNGNSHALHDIELGLKHSLLQSSSSAITLEIIAIAPIGAAKSSVRYGKPGLQASLLLSQILSKNPNLIWLDSGLGYRFYQGFPSDQIRAFLALGLDATPFITFIATGELACGLFNGEEKKNFNNIAFNPNYRLVKGKIECLIHYFDPIALSIGGYQHFWGENVGAGGGLFCGTWLYF